MALFEVRILGSNSAIPAHGRFPSAQWVEMDSRHFLIDCGEGTQIRIMEYRLKMFRLERIFISHLHGDHIFGLPGLLTTMALQGRTEPLTLYGPSGLRHYLDQVFRSSGARFSFSWEVVEHDATGLDLIFEDHGMSVHALPLDHGVVTNGYLFTLKASDRKLNGDKANDHSMPFEARVAVKKGSDYTDESGRLWEFEEFTTPGNPERQYAYCSDTRYNERILPYIKGVDLLYHEATYLNELSEQAWERHHTTAHQAGALAAKAGVGKLLIGHISSRYSSEDALLAEARSNFKHTQFAKEGLGFVV